MSNGYRLVPFDIWGDRISIILAELERLAYEYAMLKEMRDMLVSQRYN